MGDGEEMGRKSGYMGRKKREREKGRDMLLIRAMRADWSVSWVYRGQYSDAVLSELENQNDQHLEGISAKVKMLKDVRLFYRPLLPFTPFVPAKTHPMPFLSFPKLIRLDQYARSQSPLVTKSALHLPSPTP